MKLLFSGAGMRKYHIVLLLFLVAPTLARGAGRDAPELFGSLRTEAGIHYKTVRDGYFFDFPLYGDIGLKFETGIVESVLTVDYVREPGLGETYIKGGTDYSFLKAGNYRERWGNGYSISPVSVLNNRDGRYPDNVFCKNLYRPNPMFTMRVGNSAIYGDFVVSGPDGVPASIYDARIGTRLRGNWEGYDMSLGFVRRAGMPPSVFFLTAQTQEADYSVWSEAGWVQNSFGDDLGSLVVGYKREVYSTTIIAEYALWGANSLMLLENRLYIDRNVDAGAKLFLHFADFRDAWSAALNLSVGLEMEKDARVEPGIILFFGKPGTYLSPFEEDNDNGLYLRFTLSF